MPSRTKPIEADVLVVGAGPAGSAAAHHLARRGIDVLLIERAAFPREKACGDGLSPRAVRALLKMDVGPDEPGFERVIGIRTYSRTTTIELPFPELEDFPNYGLTCKRMDLDELLARRAEKAGARLMERTEAVGVVRRDGWVTGASVRPLEDGEDAPPVEARARFVIASDGASSKLGTQAGVRRVARCPLGIAARRYYRIPRHPGPWFESWVDLWEADSQLPGYGWLFPLADGTVNLGAGLLDTFKGFKDISAQRLFAAFAKMMPESWGVSEETAVGHVLSGPLPMGFNRAPSAVPGMLLIGDAAGMVNPFNGEGIAYAMESGAMAAETIVQALGRATLAGRERALEGYPLALKQEYGGYFTLGRVFVKLIGNPNVMKVATRHGLPHPTLMRLTLKLLANLTDPSDGDAMDRVINALTKVAPAA